MFTEHVGNLQAAKSLDELKQVLEQILGDCESALTHDGSLRIRGALPVGATDGVLHVSNGYIAPNDADTEPDANGELPNGWAHVVDGAAWFQGQVRFDKAPWGDGAGGFAALPAGSVIMWAGSVGSIPSGWALMNGTDNSVGNGGSGIDMRGLIPYGYSGAGAFATIGASVALTFTGFEINGNSTTPSVTVSNATTGISISNHSATACTVTDPGHYHDLESFTSAVGDSDATSPASVVTSVNSTTDGATTGITVSTPTLSHSITEPNSGTGHTHTATVSIDNIAAALVWDAPTTLRTPGVVLAYIEKLAA